MSYEAFRELCAKICDNESEACTAYSGKHRAASCATKIRAVPLPEVKQEPVAWFRDLNQEPISDGYKKARMDDFYKHHTIPCYLLPPDAEALRKENEKLRERITEIERISYSARCALQADVNDRDEVIANCSDKIRILESKLAALKGGAS